jgi:hypothetical protein
MSVHQVARKWRYVVPVAVLALGGMATVVPAVSAKRVLERPSLETFSAATATLKGPAMPAAGMVLGGFTSQHEAIALEISKKDKRVDLIGTALDMTCTSGTHFSTPDRWQRLSLSPKGTVHAAGSIPPATGPDASGTTFTGGMDTD